MHHLLGGRFGRIDDRRNFLMLCGGWCHLLAEKHQLRGASGELVPYLTLANCLWLKKESDQEWYDIAYLQQLAGKWRLPEPEEPARCLSYRPR